MGALDKVASKTALDPKATVRSSGERVDLYIICIIQHSWVGSDVYNMNVFQVCTSS